VLRDPTSRGLYVRVWPPHTSERRGGGGGCEQEGWQGGEGRAGARIMMRGGQLPKMGGTLLKIGTLPRAVNKWLHRPNGSIFFSVNPHLPVK